LGNFPYTKDLDSDDKFPEGDANDWDCKMMIDDALMMFWIKMVEK
jgi:hypothetical protein